jgi:thioredoxin 1
MFNLFKKRIKAQILTKSDFENIVTNKQSAVIMFGAGWCGACKMQKPIINEMAHHHKDSSIVIGIVDTDQESSLSRTFEISALPTTIAVKGDKILFKKSGLITRGNLENIFSELEKTSA